MAVENTTTSEATEAAEAATEASTSATTTEASTEGSTDEGAGTEGEGEGNTPDPEDELPEWARKELTRARGEAANYRTQLRKAQDELKSAKSGEEYEQAVANFSAKVEELEHALLVSTVARKHNLPGDLAARLRGATEAELEEDAKALAKYAVETAPPERLRGGLDPSSQDDTPDDPGALARQFGRGRKRA